MDKRNKEHFVRTLKMFCITFIVVTLIYIIIDKFLYPNDKSTLSEKALSLFFISLISSIDYFKRYKKYSEKIMFEELSNTGIIVKLHEIMKRMHWSLQNTNSNQIVFRSSVFRTFLTEHFIINIEKNSLELIGPKYYVKKVSEKLRT